MAGSSVNGVFTSCPDVVERSGQLEPNRVKKLAVRRKTNAVLETEAIASVIQGGSIDMIKH